MFTRLCDAITAVVEMLLAAGFFALIATVSFQVLGRALLSIPAIWTLELAQLLFTWLIFVGAAVALRKNVHYVVDILPTHWPLLNRALAFLSMLAAVVIIYALTVAGWRLAILRSSAVIPSLHLSMFWTFLAMPVSGGLMALYTVEHFLIFLKGDNVEIEQIIEEDLGEVTE